MIKREEIIREVFHPLVAQICFLFLNFPENLILKDKNTSELQKDVFYQIKSNWFF